jgi:hypothetical protein
MWMIMTKVQQMTFNTADNDINYWQMQNKREVKNFVMQNNKTVSCFYPFLPGVKN